MVSSNVELARAIFADWERGDYGSADWANPQIEYVHADGPDPGVWTGLPGMANAFGEWLNAWQDYRVDAEQNRELGDDRVIVLYRRSGRGNRAGSSLDRCTRRERSCSTSGTAR